MKLAQINFEDLQKELPGMKITTNSNIGDIISKIIPYLFAGAGVLLLIYLVLGGLELIFSLGDPKKTASARGRITQALLGFLVVFFAFLIVRLIGAIFKIQDLQNIFPIPGGNPGQGQINPGR